MTEPASDEFIEIVQTRLNVGWKISSGDVAMLLARIRQQDEQIRRMDEALEPFAECVDFIRATVPDTKDTKYWTFQAGDFRAARAARKEPT